MSDEAPKSSLSAISEGLSVVNEGFSVVNEAKKLVEVFCENYPKAKDYVSHLLKLGVKRYLDIQTSKYLFVNTFLHQEQKVQFDKFYFPLTVSTPKFTPKRKKSLKFSFPIKELGEKFRFVVILGDAGSGKTMLTKHIFLSAIKENKKIPVIIELRSLNTEHISMKEYLFQKLLNSRIKPNENYLEESFENGDFLLILDGYDELYSSELIEVNKQIQNFIDKYNENYFIITSRPGTGVERLERFITFNVDGLKPHNIVDFVRKMLVEDEVERQENILRVIRNENTKDISVYLSNPLLLSMFLKSFKKYPSIPKNRSTFYRNIFHTLYDQHDGINKNSYERERISGLNENQFERLISYFAYRTYFDGKYYFEVDLLKDIFFEVKNNSKSEALNNLEIDKLIHDLHVSINILIKDGTEFQFPHRSLQEYFAVNHIKMISNEVADPSEMKQKIYYYFYSNILKKSNDSFENFLILCRELDNYGFNRYCIIPILEDIILKDLINDKKFSYLPSLLSILNIEFKIVMAKSSNLKQSLQVELLQDKIPAYFKVLHFVKYSNLFEWLLEILAHKELRRNIKDSLNSLFKKNEGIFDFSKEKNLIFKSNELLNKTEVVTNAIYIYLNKKGYKKKLQGIQKKISETISKLKVEDPKPEDDLTIITF